MMKRIILTGAIAALAFMSLNCGGPATVTKQDPPPTTTTEPKNEQKPPDTNTGGDTGEKRTVAESQFQTIYYDFDKYNLRADARTSLDANAQLMKEFPDVMVSIEGHCDERGTVEYNMLLGERRARSAMEYMVGQGISAGRLSIKSWGKEHPVSMGSSEDAWAKNRRAEFKIVSQ